MNNKHTNDIKINLTPQVLILLIAKKNSTDYEMKLVNVLWYIYKYLLDEIIWDVLKEYFFFSIEKI